MLRVSSDTAPEWAERWWNDHARWVPSSLRDCLEDILWQVVWTGGEHGLEGLTALGALFLVLSAQIFAARSLAVGSFASVDVRL